MNINKNVIILYNKINWETADELDVLIQVVNVEKALLSLNYSVHRVEFSKDINSVMKLIEKIKPLFVFNLVESFEGNNKLLYMAASLLEFLNVDYTGGNSENLFATTNKILTKKILKGFNVKTPEWIEYYSDVYNYKNGKYIIKPVCEEGSVDISNKSVVMVSNFSNLKNILIEKRNKEGKEYFAERYISGREFNISLLGDEHTVNIFPPTEIIFLEALKNEEKILNYDSKWNETSVEYQNTIRNFNFEEKDRKIINIIKESAFKCWKVFNLKGYARIDYRVDKFGQPWILEINSNPCISPDSGFVSSLKNEGIDYINMVKEIIKYRNKNLKEIL